MPLDRETLHKWLHHWQDEYDAAFLYLVLAGQEPEPKRKDVYIKLAGVEERHVQMWEKLLADHGHRVGRPRPSLNARLRAWVGRRFGPNYLLPLLLREEGQEVKGYMDLHKEVSFDDAREVSLKLAKESAAHAETLAGLAGRAAEPWHKTGSGGFLRNVVYGFNDGLRAKFGLVAGVIGADVAPHIVLVSGIAGMFADALSMGASGYLAAKSEQEVYDHEIAMEKEEIRIMPEVEEEELALVYQTKGIEAGIARQMAAEVMRDSQRALDEQVREELKIGEAHATPLKEGWVTGASTAVGALIPVAPFLVLSGPAAAWTAFAIPRPRTLPFTCTTTSTSPAAASRSSNAGQAAVKTERSCPKSDHSSSARWGAYGATMTTRGSIALRVPPPSSRTVLRYSIIAEMAVL